MAYILLYSNFIEIKSHCYQLEREELYLINEGLLLLNNL
jgi:hypothetical protein